ncbi:hypothetical protein EJ06DRAFT_526716 [Trichodelitschia bisporula]|uniref:Uncharacterized protein n=1 Tax=Trichodelitschia bisporula TaxID=703511 RepID=A0A6G1I9H4_9PEZI|nr:hypothetical protein EJ06DRAFT_526716 [Trichodelitschia bisporula]
MRQAILYANTGLKLATTLSAIRETGRDAGNWSFVSRYSSLRLLLTAAAVAAATDTAPAMKTPKCIDSSSQRG